MDGGTEAEAGTNEFLDGRAVAGAGANEFSYDGAGASKFLEVELVPKLEPINF